MSKMVNTVNIRDKTGSTVYSNVDIAPTADRVLVKSTDLNSDISYTSLQDFLFAKFYDTEIEGQIFRRKANLVIGQDDQGKDIILPDYYSVNVNAQSLWQTWNDYQEILKKRLTGFYDSVTNDYQAALINKNELINTEGIEQQKAKYSLTEGDAPDITESESMLAAIADRYNLTDDTFLDSNGQLTEYLTKEQQAQCMLMNFGQESFWQRVLDNFQDTKNRLWGIYNEEGNVVGYFEKSRNNIDQLKEIYGTGPMIEIEDENGFSQKIENKIATDEEALEVLVDLQSKSIYQHLLELKDFWISLPIEYYGRDYEPGVSIANEYDIKQLKNSWKLISLAEGLEYRVYDTYVEVVGIGTYQGRSLIIPDTYNGLPVTSIGYGAFYGCTSLTSMTIPDSVTSIGNGAFRGCSSLTSITIPDSVTNIGDSVFLGCESLTSIMIPDGVTGIDNWVFAYCKSLVSVTIGDSVTSIGSSAFHSCESLTSVTIGNSVTSIGSDAFNNCTSLTNVTIPDSVMSIGDWAFYDCTSLTSITIPDGVTSIGKDAFKGCTSLTDLYIDKLADSISGAPWGATGATIHWNS